MKRSNIGRASIAAIISVIMLAAMPLQAQAAQREYGAKQCYQYFVLSSIKTSVSANHHHYREIGTLTQTRDVPATRSSLVGGSYSVTYALQRTPAGISFANGTTLYCDS